MEEAYGRLWVLTFFGKLRIDEKYVLILEIYVIWSKYVEIQKDLAESLKKEDLFKSTQGFCTVKDYIYLK